MPWENVGSCGSGQLPNDRDWIIQCYELALSYLRFVMPPPPDGCELGIMWHEHELGDYPSIGLNWDFPQRDIPWNYVNKCETLLSRFDDAVDWSSIDPDAIYEELDSEVGKDEEDDDDE